MIDNTPSYFAPMDEKDFSSFDMKFEPSDYSPVRFPDFETIPKCTKYSYPAFKSLKFIMPNETEGWEIFNVDGLKLLSSLGIDQLRISPIKWDQVKGYIASGTLVYPESNSIAQIRDGRHRTLALMKIYGLTHTPCAVHKDDVANFLINAEHKGLLK